MTLLFVILGVVFQAFFALSSFTLMAFTAGASVPGGLVGVLIEKSVIGVPVISVCIAIASIVMYLSNASPIYYWVHALPVILLVLFFVFRLP